MKHFAAKGATEVDEAGKLIYAALLKVRMYVTTLGSLNINISTTIHMYLHKGHMYVCMIVVQGNISCISLDM